MKIRNWDNNKLLKRDAEYFDDQKAVALQILMKPLANGFSVTSF